VVNQNSVRASDGNEDHERHHWQTRFSWGDVLCRGRAGSFWCSFGGEMAQDEIGGTIEGKGVEPDHEV
jgi:hypothetical protein